MVEELGESKDGKKESLQCIKDHEKQRSSGSERSMDLSNVQIQFAEGQNHQLKIVGTPQDMILTFSLRSDNSISNIDANSSHEDLTLMEGIDLTTTQKLSAGNGWQLRVSLADKERDEAGMGGRNGKETRCEVFRNNIRSRRGYVADSLTCMQGFQTSGNESSHVCVHTRVQSNVTVQILACLHRLKTSFPPKLEAVNFDRSQEWFSESSASTFRLCSAESSSSAKGQVEAGVRTELGFIADMWDFDSADKSEEKVVDGGGGNVEDTEIDVRAYKKGNSAKLGEYPIPFAF